MGPDSAHLGDGFAECSLLFLPQALLSPMSKVHITPVLHGIQKKMALKLRGISMNTPLTPPNYVGAPEQ